MANEYLQVDENAKYVLAILDNLAENAFVINSIYEYYLENKSDKAASGRELFTAQFVAWSLIKFFNKIKVKFVIEKAIKPGFFMLDYKYQAFKRINNKFTVTLPKLPFIVSVKSPSGFYVHKLNSEFKADTHYKANLAEVHVVTENLINWIIMNLDRYQSGELAAVKKSPTSDYLNYLSAERANVNATSLLPIAPNVKKRLIFFSALQPVAVTQAVQQTLTTKKSRAEGTIFKAANKPVETGLNENNADKKIEKMEISFLLNPESYVTSLSKRH